MKIKMPRMGGLPMPEASLPKVPGAPASPKVSSPMKVGEQATVKMPKSKKMADATDKPSVFFKAEGAAKRVTVENLKNFLGNKKRKRQSSTGNERLSMDHDKKISAREAAQAVLAKAHEMLKASKLSKCGSGTFTKVHAEAKREGHSEESADKIAGKAKAMEKGEHVPQADQSMPDGTETQRTPPDNYNGNPAPGAPRTNLGSPYKGHIKLAKFMGRMEAKRAQKSAQSAGSPIVKAETGHEKGVHPAKSPEFFPGMSQAGNVASVDKPAAVSAHKQVLSEIKGIKPKLPE